MTPIFSRTRLPMHVVCLGLPLTAALRTNEHLQLHAAVR